MSISSCSYESGLSHNTFASLALKTEDVEVLIEIEAALIRAERRVAFGATRRADAAVEIVGHGTPVG